MPIWIGTADLDRLFSYPQRHNLSSSWFPIHFVAACAHTRPHVGSMMCTWALSCARGPDDVRVGSAAHAQVMGLTCVSRGLRAYQGVNVQPLVAAVARFRFQAGEEAFLFSFLPFHLPGYGSSFSCRAFAFCLNRCL